MSITWEDVGTQVVDEPVKMAWSDVGHPVEEKKSLSWSDVGNEDTGQSFAGSMGNSLGGGFEGGLGSTVEGVGDIASIIVGDNPLQDLGQSIKDDSAERFPINPANSDKFAVKAAGVVGQVGEQVAEAVTGVTALKAVQGATNVFKAGRTIALGGAFLKGADAGEDVAKQYGITGDASRAAAILGMGAIEAGTEAIGGLGGHAPLTGGGLKGLLKTAGVEGGEEIAAGILGDTLTRTLAPSGEPGKAANGTPLPNPLDVGKRAEEFALGAVGGGVFGIPQLIGGSSPQSRQAPDSSLPPVTPTESTPPPANPVEAEVPNYADQQREAFKAAATAAANVDPSTEHQVKEIAVLAGTPVEETPPPTNEPINQATLPPESSNGPQLPQSRIMPVVQTEQGAQAPKISDELPPFPDDATVARIDAERAAAEQARRDRQNEPVAPQEPAAQPTDILPGYTIHGKLSSGRISVTRNGESTRSSFTISEIKKEFGDEAAYRIRREVPTIARKLKARSAASRTFRENPFIEFLLKEVGRMKKPEGSEAPTFHNKGLIHPTHQTIWGGEMDPGKAAQAAYEANWITAPDVGLLYEKISESSRGANSKSYESHVATQEQQFQDFQSAVQSGETKVHAQELTVGSTLEIEGEMVKVKAVNTDEDGNVLSVDLQDGTRFGLQSIAGDESIFVENAEIKPFEDVPWGEEGTPETNVENPVNSEQSSPSEPETISELDRKKATIEELKFQGAAYDGRVRYAIKQGSNGQFYVETTIEGEREVASYGHEDIESAVKSAESLILGELETPTADPFREDFLSGTQDDPFNLVSETTEERKAREAREAKAEKAKHDAEVARLKAEAEQQQGNLFGSESNSEKIDRLKRHIANLEHRLKQPGTSNTDKKNGRTRLAELQIELSVAMKASLFDEAMNGSDSAFDRLDADKETYHGAPPQGRPGESRGPRFASAAEFQAAFEAAFARGDFDAALDAVKAADRSLYAGYMRSLYKASNAGDTVARNKVEWFRHIFNGIRPPGAAAAPTPQQPGFNSTTDTSAGHAAPTARAAASTCPAKTIGQDALQSRGHDSLGHAVEFQRADQSTAQSRRGRATGSRGMSGAAAAMVELHKHIFKDPQQAAKTLAHEIGHVIDWVFRRFHGQTWQPRWHH